MVIKKIGFGRLLREFMDISHIKVPQISKVTKYEISTIYKWLNGERLPSQSNINEIVATLSEYFAGREERTMKLIHSLVDKQNIAHGAAPVSVLDRHAIEEVLFNAFDFSLNERKLINHKNDNIPSYFKECQTSFMVSSYSDLVNAYIHFFDELAAKPTENKNIIVVTGTFDEYAVISRSSRILLEKMAKLTQNGYKIEWVLLLDKNIHRNSNVLQALINVLSFMGNGLVSIRFAEKSYATNFCDKVFIAAESVAAETISVSTIAPEATFITYDRNIVDTLYSAYQGRLPNLKLVFEEINIYDFERNFSSLTGGRFCSLSSGLSIDLLQLDFLLSGKLGERFDEVVKGIKANIHIWKQYEFATKETYHMLNIESFNRFVVEGEMLVGDQTFCCPVATRIDVLENILDSVTKDIFYKLVLYNDNDDEVASQIKNIIIFNEHNACLRLKNTKYGWLRLNDEYFVAGLESYFNTAFTKFYKEKINSRDGVVKLLENNIKWLKSQENL